MDDLGCGLRSKYVRMFLESSAELPRFDRRFTLSEQLETEKVLKRFIDETTSKVEKRPHSAEGRMAEVEKLKASVKAFVAKSFWSPEGNLEADFVEDFSSVGEEFVRKARALDRQISLEDIHQALRNVWIVNSLQVFLGREVALSPSGFAYSLLYPYTDNYLDDPRVSMESKKEFVRALGRRLEGENLQSRTAALAIPFELIRMIESEYPRSSFSEVYLALLAIHHAQEEALAQQAPMQSGQASLSSENIGGQGRERSLSEMDILEMSVEKGGTSVLADAYLVDGTLEDQVKDFAFGLGVCLQLIDDLQDLEEDLRRGHQTLMSMSATVGPLDTLTNRLMNFIMRVLELGNQFHSHQAQALLELSRRSCIFLVIEAAARVMDRYTSDYIHAFEAYSPLRFSFLKSLKEDLKQKGSVLMGFGNRSRRMSARVGIRSDI